MSAKTFTPADFIAWVNGDQLVAQMLANQANFMQNPPAERDPFVAKLVDHAMGYRPDDSNPVHPVWGSGPRVVDPFEVQS